jgi:gliding motility-associated-like protein
MDGDVGPILAEKAWGAGWFMVGGMTTTGWHSPSPECFNVRMNMFRYAISKVDSYISFSYPDGDTVFCQYDDDVYPIFAPESDTGTFMATPFGLDIDSLTGVIHPGTSLPGVYEVTNIAPHYCGSLDSTAYTIVIEATPVANAGPDVYVCRGQNVQLDGSGGATYQWIPAVYLDDATLEDPTVTAPPTNVYYQMIATSALGCSDTDDVWAYLYPDPIIDAGEDIIMTLGGFSELSASGAVSYVWSPDTWLSDPNSSNPTCFAEDTIMYVVTGTDANGCIGTDTMWVYVLEDNDIVPPTAFTPNGDGMNDVYRPLFVGVGGEVSDFVIYNRWGAQVFISSDPEIGWDGTFNGIEQEIGTYIVHVNGLNQFGEPISKTSTLVLLR